MDLHRKAMEDRMRPTYLCRIVVQDGTDCAEMVSPVQLPVETHRTVYSLTKLEASKETRQYGVVDWWNHTYGFIATSAVDGKVYVHQSDCKQPLATNMIVSFDMEFSEQHKKHRAINCIVTEFPPLRFSLVDMDVLPIRGDSLHDLRAMGCNLPLSNIGNNCIRPMGRYIFVRQHMDESGSVTADSDATDGLKQEEIDAAHSKEGDPVPDAEEGEITSDESKSVTESNPNRFSRKRNRNDSEEDSSDEE